MKLQLIGKTLRPAEIGEFFAMTASSISIARADATASLRYIGRTSKDAISEAAEGEKVSMNAGAIQTDLFIREKPGVRPGPGGAIAT